MRRAGPVLLAALVVLSTAGAGCARRFVATPAEVRANHDRAWTIESLPADEEPDKTDGAADDRAL